MKLWKAKTTIKTDFSFINSLIFRNHTDYDLVDETIVSTGELTTVKPGVYHRFEAIEDTTCYEIYLVEWNHNDIEREDVGGFK